MTRLVDWKCCDQRIARFVVRAVCTKVARRADAMSDLYWAAWRVLSPVRAAPQMECVPLRVPVRACPPSLPVGERETSFRAR